MGTKEKVEVQKMLCPFHKEKTPSMTYSLQLNRYSCFSCGDKGTVDHLIRDLSKRLKEEFE